MEKNLQMAGDPRYQPLELTPYFGYDNLYRGPLEVELAGLDVFYDVDLIPAGDYALLTPDLRSQILHLTTTEIDRVEAVLHHDVLAMLDRIKTILPEPLHLFLHIPFTSYDDLDTGRMLHFVRADREVVRPKGRKFIELIAGKCIETVDVLQMGRTHGQFAIPRNAGVWLARILYRFMYNFSLREAFCAALRGKIAGAIGCHNAEVAIDLPARCGAKTFEERVLEKLDLKAMPISSQIMIPEPLAYYLFTISMLSSTLGNFGRDCRHLMRSEIGEVGLTGDEGGSSTMANKAGNPTKHENAEGMSDNVWIEFGRVQRTLISECDRDLVGSSIMRGFPAVLTYFVYQINNYLRLDKKTNKTFIERLLINRDACKRNFELARPTTTGELLYIALQLAGYPKNAHQLVNKVIAPMSRQSGGLLIDEAFNHARVTKDHELDEALQAIPDTTFDVLKNPEDYVGLSRELTLMVVDMASKFLNQEHVPADWVINPILFPRG